MKEPTVSKKYEDGIWLLKGTDGYTHVRFVKDGRGSITLIEGELQAPSSLDFFMLTPIRRVADLEGRPVVDEGVIEAIADSLQQDLQERPNVSLNRESRIAILKQHLSPSREQGEGEHDLYAHKCGAPCKACEADRPSEAERLLRLTCERVCETPADEQSNALADVSLGIEGAFKDLAAERDELKGKHSDASEYVSRLLQLLKKIRKLVSSVPGAPQVMGLSDSEHDSVAVGYVEWLVGEFANLQARIAELEANPPTTTATHRETATMEKC